MNPEILMADKIAKILEDEHFDGERAFARTPETRALMLRVAACAVEHDVFNSVDDVFGRIWDLSDEFDGDYAECLAVINIQERANARVSYSKDAAKARKADLDTYHNTVSVD